MARTVRRPFREIAFVGGRFDEGGYALDLSVLNEIRVYRKVVVETAKEIWRRRNDAGWRDPHPEFAAGFRLGIAGEVGAGRGRIFIDRIWDADSDGALAADEPDFFDEAADMIDKTLAAFHDERRFIYDMPRSKLGELAKLGGSLAPDESAVLSKPGERGAAIDCEIRRRIADKAFKPRFGEARLKGKVRGMELRNVREGGSFKIKLDYGYTVPGSFSAEQESVIAEALRSRRSVRLKLRALCEYPPVDGKIRRIAEIYDCEIVQDADEPVHDLTGFLKKMEEMHKSMPPDACADMPTDGARNYKHYLYGFPKEEDEEA